MAKRYTRRSVVAASGAALLSACSPSMQSSPPNGEPTNSAFIPSISRDGVPAPTATPAPPTATPTRVPQPKGSQERAFLSGSQWESVVSIRHSGKPGPTVIVLGGVHGNEPGGWQAALDIASWEPAAGSLIVLPRANRRAIDSFVRTFDEIGDLNRLYPGNFESTFAMERMAAEIMQVAREFDAELLLDMHESWQFYVDAPGTGTAALGQTITAGIGPANPALAQAVVTSINPGIGAREQLILRDGRPFARPTSTPAPGTTARGRSSLSVNGFQDRLTPILVEMGQQGQEIPRRVELHLIVAQTTLQVMGTL